MNPFSRLGAAFLRDHPASAAEVLENFPAESVARFLGAASRPTALEVLPYFSPPFAAGVLTAAQSEQAAGLFAQLLPDVQIGVLRQMDRAGRERFLDALPTAQALTLRRLLPYPDGTAGAMMEALVASVPEGLPARHALKRIKRMRRGPKFYVYATTPQGQLTGVMTLHELLNALPSTPVLQLMRRPVVALAAGEPLRTVIKNPYWQDYHALPVVDENRILLGVIRQKQIRRLQEQAPQRDIVSGGLTTLVAAGELFSRSAGHLLGTLIETIGPAPRGDRRD